MKFWIITPTYNRYELLKRCIKSILKQSYATFEMIVIDDSTNNKTFYSLSKDFQDDRIKYIKNIKNSWVNFSRNKWLDSLSKDVDYVIFLDDDDFFDIKTLEIALQHINNNKDYDWFISNKKTISKIKRYNQEYDYVDDYLFWDKIQWDVTHCISNEAIGNARFSKYIKQAQEWLFFSEISHRNKIYTYDFDSTVSEYLDGWLSDNSKLNVITGQIKWIIEFFLIRKILIKYKIYFLRKLLWKFF